MVAETIPVMSYQDNTLLESQNTFTKSNHQASADSDNPSWATLSAETTSGEEEALDLESQATTPDPVEEKQPSSHTTTHHSRASLATLFPYWQFTSILDSHSAPTIHKRPSNHLKRKPTSDSLSTYVSLAKKTKASPPPHLHVTHLGHHPLQPTNHPSPSYNSALPWGPTTAQAAPHLHLSTASQTQQHTHFSSHAMRTSLPSALTHQTLQLQKPLPPITNSSSIEDWTSVDDALRTQTASCHILHTSAQFPAPWEPEGAVLGRAGGVCIPLTQFANLEKESKGKARAVPGRTAPRWSNVGKFKSRLDAMYGPGDINRGLGRGPKNIHANNVESGTAPNQPALVGLRDPQSAQGSALTEDEDNLEMSLGGTRRGRLENLSPQKDTRAFRRHGASGKSPEIE